MRTSKYTKEFKDSTIELIINNKESVPKIAADLDIHVKTLYNWISTYKKAHNIPVRGMNTSSNETLNEENIRLRKENKLLKQERDILKKATAYFAKEVL